MYGAWKPGAELNRGQSDADNYYTRSEKPGPVSARADGERGIGYVVILDPKSRVLAQSGLPPDLVDEGPAKFVSGTASPAQTNPRFHRPPFLRAERSRIDCSGTGMSADLDQVFDLAGGRVKGHVRAAIEQHDIDRELTELVPQHILLYAVLVLVALTINVALAHRVATPVKAMARVAKQIAAGDLPRVEHGWDLRDEVGELARDFNHMADHLPQPPSP